MIQTLKRSTLFLILVVAVPFVFVVVALMGMAEMVIEKGEATNV